MLEVDLEGDLEAIMRIEAGPLVVLAYFDRLQYSDETLGRRLLFDSGGLDKEHERARAAIHDGYFGGAQIDISIVDTHPRHGGEEVFDRGHAHVVPQQGGRHAGVAHVGGHSRHFRHRIHIHAPEHDAGVGRGRAKGHEDLFACMNANPGRLDDVFECSLPDHQMSASSRKVSAY